MDNLIKKDLKYIWHPYTQMKDCEKYPPILIEKAKGVKLYDNKGNFYYDTISSWWCNIHGHNHPRINRAIIRQLNDIDHILFAGFTHKPAIRLAEKLASITPKGLDRIFFSDNGSTAVESALKMSFQFWQNSGNNKKTNFVSLDYAYHGDTIGSMSVSGVDLFNKVFKPLFFKSFKIPSPYCYRCPANKKRPGCNIECIKPLDSILKRNSDKICAVILEPLVMAAGGMIIYPKEYLIKVKELTRKYNVHLILDEVATGFGRTGKMFACEHVQIVPDFICISKGITAGYLPLAATITNSKIYNAFYADYDEKKTFYHGHTYTANPIACAAALASLNTFEKEDTINKLKDKIRTLKNGIQKFKNLKYVGDVRYIGMIAAIELVQDKNKKTPFKLKDRIGMKVFQMGLKKNLLLRPLGNIIYLFLPLSIKQKELIKILNNTYKVIESL